MTANAMEPDATVERGRWYPNGPPKLPGETDEQYTDRLTGADRTGRVPYDHRRNRQCSIGWHEECSDREHSGRCKCPHHEEVKKAWLAVIDWNERYPVGTRVALPLARPAEPPTVTTSPARFQPAPQMGAGAGWPVVDLEGFDNPVTLSWLVAEQ